MSQRDMDKAQKELNEIEIDEMNEVEHDMEGEESCKDKENYEIDTAQCALDKKDEEIDCLKDQIKRLAAEFDNYKKRTVREKEKLYNASTVDTIACFLPVLDNIELALNASDCSSEQSIRDGVNMIYRQFQEALTNLGVEYIDVIGGKFDPQLHEAVMHVEDEEYGDNEIIEEFRKGYIYKDGTVIRHSVVKVAN